MHRLVVFHILAGSQLEGRVSQAERRYLIEPDGSHRAGQGGVGNRDKPFLHYPGKKLLLQLPLNKSSHGT